MKIKNWLIVYALLFLGGITALAQNNVDFDEYFENKTLRLDYLRQGCKKHDTCIAQRWLIQNSNMWAGSLTQLLDPINNGEYRLLVKDYDTGHELYSRCYNTLFEEYRETIASRDKDSIATFEEVMLMPLPKKKAYVCLQKRDSNDNFETATLLLFDPSTYRPVAMPAAKKSIPLHVKGDSHKKIDIVIVAEGYGKKDKKKMEKDFKLFTKYLLAQEPFKSRAADFNVWGIGELAKESGVSDPNAGRYVESAVGSSYDIFGMDRYLMTTQLFKLHNLIREVPYDHIIIMANCDTYGGGAIYNYYAFSAVLKEWSMWILPHELGHSIGGLADEYVEDDPNYNKRYGNREPLEPNITTLHHFDSKWADMVEKGTPIPTKPVEGLGKRDNGPVGAYEGGGYLAKGVYRPCTKCMMRDYANFCPVCKKRMNEVFDLYVK